MSISKRQAGAVSQKGIIGEVLTTGELSPATGVTPIFIRLDSVAEKVTLIASGTFTGNVEFGITESQTHNSSVVPAAGTPFTFSSHLTKVIKITRTGGTGSVIIATR